VYAVFNELVATNTYLIINNNHPPLPTLPKNKNNPTPLKQSSKHTLFTGCPKYY